MPRFLQALDPRRSLTTAVTWLAVLLSLATALALLGVGAFAINSMLAQRDALMARFAGRLAAELDRTLAAKLRALQSLSAALPAAATGPAASKALDELLAANAGFATVALVDAEGRLVAHPRAAPSLAPDKPWDERCLQHAGLVRIEAQGRAGSRPLMLCAPRVDSRGRAMQAITAELSAEHLATVVEQVRARVKPDARARVLLLDERHDIRFELPAGSAAQGVPLTAPGVSLQRFGDKQRQVVVTAPLDAASTLRALGLQVAVVQPSEESGHEGTLQEKLVVISILLSILAALIGVAFARHLTRRLSGLTVQVQRVAEHAADTISAPEGNDEVAVLGRAFSHLLQALRKERDELDRLAHELEQRVEARTREVERLAADSRYAAVVRERLRLARDLHDTLAHSMMEMLVEVRTLRMLHAHDPGKLASELERAEQVAHQGLKEAREAVSQIRLNTVRDLGLGAALGSAVTRFSERTGLQVRYSADPQAASFADARAEVVFRIAEEALRNIDRHAQASHVDVDLKDAGNGAIELAISDDGLGFDPAVPHPGHYGLIGIQEQAQLIDAELELHSAPGAGTRLRLRLGVGPEMRRSADDAVDALKPPG